MPFRFIHTADLHLDSPLRSLALRDETLAALIGTATRSVLTRLVDLCLETPVDALLIVGDLYDGAQTSMKTAAFLAGELARLDDAGIRTFIVRGNHDAESTITRELLLPDSVHVFSGRAGCQVLEGAADGRDVAVHGISFRDRSAPTSLLPKFRPAVPDALNIGLLHTSLGGAAGHDTYAPCSIADLVATGFDYWALGHVHQRAVHRPARPAIVMPGQPQGRDINEAGPKSVTLVTLAGDGAVTVEERTTAVAAFARVPVDATGLEDWRDLTDAGEAALSAARAATPTEHLVARLTVTGSSPLAWRVRVDADLLLAEVRTRAARLGNTWVESVETDVRPPPSGPVGAGTGTGTDSGGDPLSELRALISGEVVSSAAFQAQAQAIAEELRGQLPKPCAEMMGQTESAFRDRLARLIEAGTDDVLAHLLGSARSRPEADS